jgi:hypothetical protein
MVFIITFRSIIFIYTWQNLILGTQTAPGSELTTLSGRTAQFGEPAASGFCTGNLVSKPKKPEPPEPLWPDGSPYVEPVQLSFCFADEE